MFGKIKVTKMRVCGLQLFIWAHLAVFTLAYVDDLVWGAVIGIWLVAWLILILFRLIDAVDEITGAIK